MAISRLNELEMLEKELRVLQTPVTAREKAAQAADFERLMQYLTELANNRGFVL